VKGFPGAGHAQWVRMKTGLAVQGALHVQSSTGPTLLVLSQWMNALVSNSGQVLFKFHLYGIAAFENLL